MFLRRNRAIAWFVLAICVIGSVIGMGGAYLHRQRRAVLDMFYDGIPGSAQRSMYEILIQAENCAKTMAAEAQQYLGDDHTAAALTLSSIASRTDNHSPDDRCAVYSRIREQTDVMYNGMYAENLLDAERVKFKRAYDEFWRCDAQIRRHPYCEEASAYNRSISAFPAKYVAAFVGAGELNSFEL